MTKLSWWRFSCLKVRRTTLSATCPRPAQPSPQPGPPPTPFTVLQSSRLLWTCSQVCPSHCQPLSGLKGYHCTPDRRAFIVPQSESKYQKVCQVIKSKAVWKLKWGELLGLKIKQVQKCFYLHSYKITYRGQLLVFT